MSVKREYAYRAWLVWKDSTRSTMMQDFLYSTVSGWHDEHHERRRVFDMITFSSDLETVGLKRIDERGFIFSNAIILG